MTKWITKDFCTFLFKVNFTLNSIIHFSVFSTVSIIIMRLIAYCNYYLTGVVEPIAVGQVAKDYLAKAVNPTLLKGLTELCKKKPKDPVVNTSSSCDKVTHNFSFTQYSHNPSAQLFSMPYSMYYLCKLYLYFHIRFFNYYVINFNAKKSFTYFSQFFQIWLADWLIENNPNKPKVRKPIVHEA